MAPLPPPSIPTSQVGGGPAPREAGNVPDGDGPLVSVTTSMHAFDALPGEVRRALAEASVDWCPVDILARWRRAARRYGPLRATRAAVRAIRQA